MGRGCSFCHNGSETVVSSCEGCYKLHSYNWLEGMPEVIPSDIYEVRFKNTRKSYYRNVNNLSLKRGDIVAVEAAPGHDIGIVSMTGDLVARQMKRIGFNPQNGEFKKIYRKAKPYDIEKWQEAIALEHETMIRARQIAADMKLNMKIGDVEYQGDKIKAIFYYIADERVDFRELIKVFAEQFRIRVEMKQIGARQEAGRIGGLGACGRELCCASWMSSFSSVTTGAARVQDISLNPQKLAGQCSKLKCCMMHEYDAYVDARKEFPRVKEPLQTLDGEWFPVKSDILGGTMTFSSSKESMANVVTLSVARVKEIQALNRQGKRVEQLLDDDATLPSVEEPTFRAEEDSITRFDQTKRRKRGGRNRNRNRADRPQEASDKGAAPERTERAEQGGLANPQSQPEAAGAPAPREERRRNNRNGRGSNNNTPAANAGHAPEGKEPRMPREGERRNENTGSAGAPPREGNGPKPQNGREGGNRNRNNRRRRGNGNPAGNDAERPQRSDRDTQPATNRE